MKLIQLGGHTKSSVIKAYTIVDDDDFEYLSSFKWSASWYPKINGFYATRHTYINGKRKTIQLGRFLLNIKNRNVVDHINGNTLDNRRENLREANYGQNRINSKIQKNNTSSIKGVSWHKGKWTSAIRTNKKTIYLGRFETKEQAGEVYRIAQEQFFPGIQISKNK